MPKKSIPNALRPETPGTILVAVGDALLRDLIALGLSREGHTIALAHDAATTLAQARNQRPDVILLDLFAPGVNSLLLLRRLNALGPDAPPPVIVLSGLGYPEVVKAARLAGAADFLVKPVEMRLLADKVGRALAGTRRGAPPRRWLAGLPHVEPGRAVELPARG